MTFFPRHPRHPGDGTSAASEAPAATTRSTRGISYGPLPDRHATDGSATVDMSVPQDSLPSADIPATDVSAQEFPVDKPTVGGSVDSEAPGAATKPNDISDTAEATAAANTDNAAQASETTTTPASDRTKRSSWVRRRKERKEQREQHRAEKAQRPRQQRFPWVLRGWGRRKIREGQQRWRQSLQFRTVTTTIVLATLILTLTLFGLSAQIAQRILDSKVAGAERDLSTARLIVESQLNGSDRSATDETRMASALAVLTAQGPQAGQLSANAGSFVPVLYIPADGLRPAISTPSNLAIPPTLVNFVSSNQVSYQYSHMDLGAGDTKVLIVGTPTNVDMPDLQLYLIYSLAGEERTLNLFNTTLFSGGTLIVILMGFASYLVSRQMVRPIRQAANAAQRFASGDLDARMEIRGEDDFARLGTSFNEMAASLQQQIVQLEEFGSAQKRFTSDVSHELRTPLTTVRMAADIIYDHADDLDPGTARASQLMVKELDKFESLLNDLLEISRHDAGVAELNSERIDIRTCVYSAIAAVSGVAASADVSAEIDMPETPVMCDVDSRRVERILRNLLANAYDHCEGKPVILTVRAGDDTVGISVRDHGVGLKPGEAKKVFDRFWRADPSRVRQSGGTGLGLAIATQDAELHGGRLEAWGMPGEGTCFRLTLPREAGHAVTSSPVPLRFPVGDAVEVTEPMATGEIPLSEYLESKRTDAATVTPHSGEIPVVSLTDRTGDIPLAEAYSETAAGRTNANPTGELSHLTDPTSGELPLQEPPASQPDAAERPFSGETELNTVPSEQNSIGPVSAPLEGLAEVPDSTAGLLASRLTHPDIVEEDD